MGTLPSWRNPGKLVTMQLPSEILSLPGGPTRVEWRRNARARRISLRIDPRGGGVVIVLPTRAGRRAGMALLMSHAEWVSARLKALPMAISLGPGAIIPLHGLPHCIDHRPTARGGVWVEGGSLAVSGEAEFLARRVGDFLRAEARRRLAALAAVKAAACGCTVRRVGVRDTRSRWGSCTRDGTLSFSWRLVMAPPFVQDYVVAHEVAHLRHMDHGPRFWALVEELTPFRATGMTWLKREGSHLLRIG